MLILSQSQAKNYLTKLHSSYHNEGCGCCWSQYDYEIKGNRILHISSGESKGHRYYYVSVIAVIKKMKDRSN